VRGGPDGVLHLHRLEDQDRVATGDAVAFRREDPADPAGHRSREPSARVVTARGPAAPGAAEFQRLAVAPDQDAVAVPDRARAERPVADTNGLENVALAGGGEFDSPAAEDRGLAFEPDLQRLFPVRELHDPALQEVGASHGSATAAGPDRAAAGDAESAS